ncbi:MAG: branched-chain amino acid ABC transporter ATP-binding protein/permease [Proteobacteria bacterium]|nr:branched-chain amino acid ABC transporter ATP-binding protein/permease [Pseudomonadota bacterium]MBI3496192.1 branched-chain amino acid ABC transporter ATP-binding protein/permease [Pseudomonadota bacterium]
MRGWLAARLNLPLVLGAALLALWPLLLDSSYERRVFTLAGIYAIMAIGYQFIFGHAGQLALTQGTFFGLGAYVTGVLATRLGWTAEATLPLSVMVPVLLAAAVALPVVRLQSHYFALATLGIAQIALLVATDWQSLTGGANGIAGVPGVSLFGWVLPSGLAIAATVWIAVALVGLLAWQLLRGRLGLAFHLARVDEMAAASIGLDTHRLRFVAFLASAAFAGLAGAFYAHANRVISPEALGLPVMIACLAIVVIGGRTRIAGAILGAVLVVHLPEWLRFLKDYYLLVYGGCILAAVVLAPEGLVGWAEALRDRLYPEPPPDPPEPKASPHRAGWHEPPRAAPLLELVGVSKRFGGVQALEHVSLRLKAGEIVGLIGPNGSGKSTLINLVSGIHRPEAGRIIFAGHDVTHLAPFEIARLGIARTFQAIKLAGEMTVLDNVAVARSVLAGPNIIGALAAGRQDPGLARSRSEAMHCLMRLGLGDVALAPAARLAHGQRRLAEIARAIATEPRLLLLDEPAAGLSEREQAELGQILTQLAETGMTLLVIEHNMPFLMGLARRIICLDRGRIVASGTPMEIRANRRAMTAYLGLSEPGS